MDIFVDSDVVISSLLSKSGAAYLLFHQKNIQPYISNVSLKEIQIVIKRLQMENHILDRLIKDRLHVVRLKKAANKIQLSYKKYVTDRYDAHIVAGVYESKTRFLISYNIKHFRIEAIKKDLGITVLTPGRLLQYMRSL